MRRDENSLPVRTVVVTGASAGVGRAAAAAFARQGASVGLIAREPVSLAEIAREVERLGGIGLPLPADVADAQAVFAAAERVERELGPIDLWVNAAMATVFAPAWALSPQELHRVTEVTYLGSAHGVLAALRHMRPRNRGTILQVGSALAWRGIPLQAGYCASKFAIRGFLDAVRCDLAFEKSRVRICMVDLPAVNTPQFDWARARVSGKPRPVAPVFQPEAVADALLRAALDPRRDYWLGWSTAKTVFGAQLLRASSTATSPGTWSRASRATSPWPPAGSIISMHRPLPPCITRGGASMRKRRAGWRCSTPPHCAARPSARV